MARSASSFFRNPPRYKVQRRVLVICEDTKSSKDYLQDAAVHFRSFATVEFSHCGHTDPLGIVTAACVSTKKYDHVYCVIDRDCHDQNNFAEATQKANGHPHVTLLTSYPCFEFWLLLHFGYTRAPYMAAGRLSAADRVIKELMTKPNMENYDKGNVRSLFASLLPRLDQAIVFASRTLEDAAADAELNPSTPLHELLQCLKDLGTPQQS